MFVPRKCALVILGAAATVAAGASHASASILINEPFTYPDGSLVGATGSPWVSHSGTLGQVDVASNKVNITGSESEDVSDPISGAPYSTGTLYAGFDVTFTALPSATGTYFSHFKDTDAGAGTDFWARLSAVADASGGTFHFTLSNDTLAAGETAVVDSTSRSLNTTYHIVLAVDTATAVGTFWVDPTSSAGGFTGTDPVVKNGADTAISYFALRQATGEGTMVIDNLIVATTFNEANPVAAPEPASLATLAAGAAMLLARRRK